MRNWIRNILLIGNGILLSACSAPFAFPTKVGSQPTTLTGLTLSASTIAKTISSVSTKLDVTFIPSNATNKTLVWTSDHPEYATVNDGYVTAIGVGTATIKAATPDGKISATCTVQVFSTDLILPLITPSRVSGIAPLYVHFNAVGEADLPNSTGASGTVSTLTTRPFHDLSYTWDFDYTNQDPQAKYWGQGVRAGLSDPQKMSKKKDYGPVVGHVFEKAGTYTVRLDVAYKNITASKEVTITVVDPDLAPEFALAKTAVVSTNGTFTGTPAGARQITNSSYTAAVADALSSGARRILFQRGQSFTAAGLAYFQTSGPILVGAIGDTNLPRPVITAQGTNTTMLYYSNSLNSAARDVRLMDLEFTSNSTTVAHRVATGDTQDFLMLRIYAHQVGALAQVGGKFQAIVDCDFFETLDDHGNMALYIQDAFGFFLAGTVLDNNKKGEYSFRFQGGTHGVVAHNHFLQCGVNKGLVTFRGDASQVKYITGKHVISDNWFDGASNNDGSGTLSINPTNAVQNERIRDVLVERNFITSALGGSQLPNYVNAVNVTFRNNVFEDKQNVSCYFLTVSYGGNTMGLPLPENVHILNNSFLARGSGTKVGVILIDVTSDKSEHPQKTVIKNNLIYAPSSSAGSSVAETQQGTATILLGNTLNSEVSLRNPNLPTSTPTTIEDFVPLVGSYVYNDSRVDADLPIWQDFFSNNRTGALDIGAFSDGN